MRALTMGVVGVCLLGLLAVPAQAELVTIQIEGVVDTVSDDNNYFGGQIQLDDAITGWYVFDSDTPDSLPDYTSTGYYEHFSASTGLFLSVNGFEFRTDPDNVDFLVAMSNNLSSGGEILDTYWITSYNNLLLEPDITVGEMTWMLYDYTATALDSIALTSTAPDPLAWDTNYLLISGTRDSPFSITGHVTSAFVIPEPCTLLFVAAGALAAIRRVR